MPTMEMDLSFACPKCAKKYRWKSTLAGKKVQCKKCSESFRMPTDPPLDDMEQGAADQNAGKPSRRRSQQKRSGSSDKAASRQAADNDAPPQKKAASNLAGGDGAGAAINAAEEANPYDLNEPEDKPAEQANVPCRECGEQISAKSVICTHCGTNQRTGEKVGGPSGKKSDGSKLAGLLKLAAVVAVLGGAAACYFLFMK